MHIHVIYTTQKTEGYRKRQMTRLGKLAHALSEERYDSLLR
jgi:hypothetical protein